MAFPYNYKEDNKGKKKVNDAGKKPHGWKSEMSSQEFKQAMNQNSTSKNSRKPKQRLSKGQNPFDAYLTAEDHLQINVIKYITFTYPNALIYHAPNEAKRTPFERFRIAKLGVKSGFPDLLIIYKGVSLYLELKVEENKSIGQKKGSASVNQQEWIKRLRENGQNAAIVFGYDESVFVIDSIFKPIKYKYEA